MSELSKLHQAIDEYNIQDVTNIINNGADVNAVFGHDTAFIKALRVRCLAVADVIMTSSKFDPNAVTRSNTSPLLMSVRENRFHYVKRLLSMGAHVNDKDTIGETLLMACAWTDNAEIAQLLIEHGADINQTDLTGRMALHHACSNVAVKVAAVLVRYKCDLNHQSNRGETPLMCALPSTNKSVISHINISDMLSISEMLIRAGSNMNAQDRKGKTALHRTVDCHDIHGLCLLAESGFEINTKDRSGETAFHLALSQYPPQFDIARFLLYYGADPNQEKRYYNGTHIVPPFSKLLQLRKSYDKPEDSWACDRLLECLQRCVYPTPALLQTISDADRNIPPEQEVARNMLLWLQTKQPCSLQFQSMLKIRQVLGSRHIFQKISGLPIAPVLKEYLCLGLQQDWLPLPTLCRLHLLIREYNNELVIKIIQDRRDINLLIEGRTPLAVAIEASNIAITRLLLNKPWLRPNIVNSLGDNALHVAAKYGRDHMVDNILKVYKDIDKVNFEKFTPLKVAMETGNFPFAAILIKKGADVTSPRGSISLLHKAAASGYLEVVELILSRGVDANLLDNFKNTPLHVVASKDCRYVGQGIPVPRCDRYSWADDSEETFYFCPRSYYRIRTDHAEVAKCLISHGASLTKLNENHQTPVQCAELYKAQGVLDVLTKRAV